MAAPRPSFFSVGEGPPLLLLHCSLSSKNQWKELSGALAPRYRCIAPDLYGYGETPMPAATRSFTLLDEVDLVLSLADELAPGERLRILGHSYGGAVALVLAHSYPDRVSSLTLFEPVAFHLLRRDDPALGEVVAMREELSRRLACGEELEAARAFIDYWSGTGAFARYPERLQKDLARRTAKLLLEFTALTEPSFGSDDYRTLAAPITVIAGTKSKAPALRVAEVLCATVPSCSMHWVDTGHMGPVTHPELLLPVITGSIL